MLSHYRACKGDMITRKQKAQKPQGSLVATHKLYETWMYRMDRIAARAGISRERTQGTQRKGNAKHWINHGLHGWALMLEKSAETGRGRVGDTSGIEESVGEGVNHRRMEE